MRLQETTRPLNIVFRVDSSQEIGSGHLMRCLTLAGRLATRARITFVCRNLNQHLGWLVERAGYRLLLLPEAEENPCLHGYAKWLTVTQDVDAAQTRTVLNNEVVDCLVVDSYALDAEWEEQLRPMAKKLLVIDDLANRAHQCDILLDQNYYSDMNERYTRLVPGYCELLLGPDYVLLRDEFYRMKDQVNVRDGRINNLFVFFGGSDLSNETMKTLQAIVRLDTKDFMVNVVVGAANRHKHRIEQFCREHHWTHYHHQVDNIAAMMGTADLAIGAGGVTTWERCYLGLPSLVVSVAENQVEVSENCANIGLVTYLGQAVGVDGPMIAKHLEAACGGREANAVMSRRCLEFMAGNTNQSDVILRLL
ncbi:MAG TPA: UDP-2,4-diacetamido-2,4,6-trideoxy-beta-L-altropyranose hydrolase [Patescibacteria group bacterium]|nr:UDP-2,4-diacetamido-2,4,6-trideoxy-beta-L-altropyranose hydrolase [Patescibacteria group bacterium]